MKVFKALIRCTHFLAHQHIAHTTNIGKLVELVVSYNGETLQVFLDRAKGNAMYNSKMAVVEFVNTLGTWVEEYSSGFIRHPFLSSCLMCAQMLYHRGADNLLSLSGE